MNDFEAEVTWNSDQSKWVLNQLMEVRNGETKPTELLAYRRTQHAETQRSQNGPG